MVMAVVVGLIIELLGIASVHTWLWLIDWNINKRKSNPESPAVIAAFLGCLYLIATIGLTVMLEVFPGLATYSPAIFPVLAIVGAVNLTLIVQQEGGEKIVKQESNDCRLRCELSRSVHQQTVRLYETVHLSNLAKLDSRMDEANTARKKIWM